MRASLLLACVIGITGCMPDGEREGEPLACVDAGCTAVGAPDVSACREAAALLDAGGASALGLLDLTAVEFEPGSEPPPAFTGELSCTTCLSSPILVRVVRHDATGTTIVEPVGEITLDGPFFRMPVQPAAVEESGSWAAQIFDAFGNPSHPVCGVYQFVGA